VASLLKFQKLRMSWADRHDTVTTERVKDLKLAASFVKSIETKDQQVNLEIQRLARQIEHIAERLRGRDS
jgi:response regulator RpfG family c-di-GMP phosphodiesterase